LKPLLVIGLALVVAGIIALAYQGITYTRSRTVLEIGPIEAKVEEKRTIPLPPVLGVLALAGGILLLVVGARGSHPASGG
jgi:Tfp pilus assembly ATPase PilU